MAEPQEEKSSEPNPQEPSNAPAQAPSPLRQIRTFQGDVAYALERQRESLVSIQQQQAARRAGEAKVNEAYEAKRRSYFLLPMISIALIGAGLFGGWLAYGEYLRKTAPPAVIAPQSRLISSNKSVDIDLTGASREILLQEIKDAAAGTAQNELLHIVLRKGAGAEAPLLTSAEFLNVLEASASGSFVRALDPVFMLGALGQSSFIIFKLSSFENAFAGMLNWEERLASDLGPIFADPELLKNIGPEDVFKDVVSRNKDARALYAPVAEGSATTTPAILYSFFDNNTLIITNDLEALRALIEKLTQELLSR